MQTAYMIAVYMKRIKETETLISIILCVQRFKGQPLHICFINMFEITFN